MQFLKQITSAACDKTIQQPSIAEVKDTILLTQGPAVTFRAFKHSKRAARTIAEFEYGLKVYKKTDLGEPLNLEFQEPGLQQKFSLKAVQKGNGRKTQTSQKTT